MFAYHNVVYEYLLMSQSRLQESIFRIMAKAKTFVFQDQITGSFGSEINDNVNLMAGSTTLLDDLNGLRTQLRKVLNTEGSWKDTPPLDLHEINARFTGSLTLNLLTASLGLFSSDLSIDGNSYIIGDVAVAGNISTLSDVSVGSSIYVSGSSEFLGPVVIVDDTSIAGNFLVSSNVDIIGDSYFQSSLFVTGSIELLGNLNTLSDISTAGDLNVLSSAEIFGSVKSHFGFSGSLTRLSDGTPAFIGGTGITITSSSNGPIVISASVSNSTAKGSLRGTSEFIDPMTGIVNFGPTGAGLGTLTIASEDVLDVYLNGVLLVYDYDIVDITTTSFRLNESLKDSLLQDDVISIILRSV